MTKTLRVLVIFTRPLVWVPLITFTLFYILYFGYTIIHQDALYGGPGDHTAGIIWLYDHSSSTPWWKYTKQTGYPWGEDLWSPIFITGQIIYIFFWLCSKIAGGSIPGYNLFTFIGFALSFTTTYVFIYAKFLKKPFLVSLSALSITFTPLMFAFDSVGFSSYLFMPAYLFIGFWLVLRVLEGRQASLSAVAIGFLIGSTFVFDPYFILFVPLAIGCFSISLLAMRYYRRFDVSLKTLVQAMCIAIAAAFILAAPVLYYIHKHNSEISQVITSTHSSQTLGDAYYDSAQIADYILPGLNNPVVPPFFHAIKAHTIHGSTSTSTLYLGWTLIIVAIFTLLWWATHRRPLAKDKTLRQTGYAFSIVAIVAFLFSLPPSVHFFSIDIYTPTWVLANLTSAWRVFSRLQTVVQPAMIMVVVCWFSEYIAKQKSRISVKKAISIASILMLVLLIEYIPRNPFDTTQFWSFSNSLPHVYTTIKVSKNTHVLAEYPMREQPYYQGSLYLTAQHLYNKPTINSYSTISQNIYIRSAIEDLSNPQTLPVLRYLGADTLLVWNTEKDRWLPDNKEVLNLIESNTYSSQFGKNDVLNLYHINEDLSERRYVAEIQNNYRPNDETQLTHIDTEIQPGISIAIVDLCVSMGKTKCDLDSTLHYYKADFINSTTKPVNLTLQAYDSSEIQHIVLQSGKSTQLIKMNSTRYIINFSQSLSSKIKITNQEIIQ